MCYQSSAAASAGEERPTEAGGRLVVTDPALREGLTALPVSGRLAGMRVYFDTNVYGCIRPEEVEPLRAALEQRQITLLLSLTDVDELLEGNRAAAMSRLRVARYLVGFDDILKQPRDLLGDAIRAYAAGEPPPSPLLPLDQRRLIAGYLYRIARGDTSLDHMVSEIVAGVRKLKDEFYSEMVQRLAQAREDWRLVNRNMRRNTTFEAYWAAGALRWAEDYAAAIGLADACRERGLDGLLNIRTVRFCVGATMSWIYSLLVGRDGQRQPQPQDGYNLWHALLASAGDVFVTQDRGLADLLERVPVSDFRVVRSLDALLDEGGVAPAR